MRDKNSIWLKVGDPVEIERFGRLSQAFHVNSFDHANIRIVVKHNSANLTVAVTPLKIRKLELEEMI